MNKYQSTRMNLIRRLRRKRSRRDRFFAGIAASYPGGLAFARSALDDRGRNGINNRSDCDASEIDSLREGSII